MRDKVSVIIPTYNRPKWLPESIESVLIQTYPDIEIIVVNDGSTDNTEQVLEPYMDKIRYIYKENGGPGSAVNVGIAASNGEYIARLDDDDLFLPKKVEYQVKMFRENPEFGLFASDHHIMNPEGHIAYTKSVPDFSKHGAFLNLLQHCIFSQPTVMARKTAYEKVGPYKNTYAQDYDMWIRIARIYPVGVIHEPLSIYRRHPENRSGKISGGKVKPDIQKFICEIMDSVSMEELFGENYSKPYAHIVRGAIFMKHQLFQRAGLELREAVKANPKSLINAFWSGILLRDIGRYEDARKCFKSIPPESSLYEDVENALELTDRFESISQKYEENEETSFRPEFSEDDNFTQLRKDTSKENNKIFDITISLAKSQLKEEI